MLALLRHRLPKGLLAVAALAVATVVLPPSSGASSSPPPAPDVPAGFTDGVPVGGPDGPTDPGSATTEPSAGTRAATHRYFGRAPWEAIQASAAATSRSCTLSDNGLTALTVAPVFKESSAATSASTAPAPMTLSRYDEWSGTTATTSNRDANYGLYAFRDPSTSYKRAFWHPGIGIWQYDTAGVGAPFTAIERMDVRVVSADVAAGMASRYCNPSPSLIGHSAPFTGQEQRNAAWAPWGYPCTLCEQEFEAMTGSSPDFATITLVDGISVTGGAQKRTCTLLGTAGTVTCWYIDPSAGVIEGAKGWAAITPLDGGSPTVAPTPLAAPFYVLDRGATEERHWLRSDTGYSIDISGSRQIGKNDRPRSNQAGSGITWSRTSALCDLTTGHGACVPQPPAAGLHLTNQTVNGTFRPIALDAQGDGKGDVLWYAPGSTRDYLWSGQGSGGFAATNVNVGGTYDDVLPLDVEGDGDDDILWYNRSTGGAYLWRSNGNGTWQAIALSPGKGLRPLVVDTDGDGHDEIFWYGPGSLPDSLWAWTGSAFSVSRQGVSGGYLPFTGDFDGDGRTDIFFYAPGSTGDHVWYGTGRGTHRDVGVRVSGLYKALVGDVDGDGTDDILWYGPGSAPDSSWFGRTVRWFETVAIDVRGVYQPFVADLEGDGRDDIIWYSPGPGADRWYRWTADRTLSSQAPVLNGDHQPVVGGFSARGTDGVFWYSPGAVPDGVWWH